MTELYDHIGAGYTDRRRPDPRLAAAIIRALNHAETVSTFSKLRASDVASGVERLRRDLADGTWRRRHGDLLDRAEIDLGYRIVVATKP